MNTSDNKQQELDDDLVAYLDGELTSTQRQQVEHRLAKEPEYRDRLRDLQTSWDLLDCLPQTMHDHSFTQTTVAMVTREASRAVRRRWLPSRQQIVTLALAATTAMLGFAIVYIPMKRRQDQMLRDLPVAQNIEIYRYADDVEFLQLLYEQHIFPAEDPDDS
jgi:anti-sigma factor RsiW